MKFLTVMALAILIAGCTSHEKQQSNERAQVEIVKVQREAMARDVANQTQAEIAMYESLAQIAANSPESSDAIVLAIAMVANNRSKDDEGQPGIVTLREQKNEAVELTKALAPTVGGMLTQVGIAALTQQTSREQIRASRDIAVNQANQTANAIESVAGLGAAAVANVGDTITVSDNGFYNSGEYTTDSGNTTTTNNTTTTSTSIADSYNSSNETNTTDSYNSTDNSVSGNTYDYSQSTVTYGGEEMTLGSLLAFLQSTNKPYVLTIGDETYVYEGDGTDPVDIDCNQPQFSPSACVVDG